MLTPQEKEFFASAAWGASSLSCCTKKHGAIIAKGDGNLFYGYNRDLTPYQESSAIMGVIADALMYGNGGVRGQGNRMALPPLEGYVLFSTKFPNVTDMVMIIRSGLSAVYFFGEVDDPDTVRLANEQQEHPVEMVQLEIGKKSPTG